MIRPCRRELCTSFVEEAASACLFSELLIADQRWVSPIYTMIAFVSLVILVSAAFLKICPATFSMNFPSEIASVELSISTINRSYAQTNIRAFTTN
jgi:hypothetical protein